MKNIDSKSLLGDVSQLREENANLRRLLFLVFQNEGSFTPEETVQTINKWLSDPQRLKEEVEKEISFMREGYGYKGSDSLI